MVYRYKLILWICKSMRAAFAGCETDPVPTNFINRFFWYVRRVIGLVRLYNMMMDHYTENSRTQKKDKVK